MSIFPSTHSSAAASDSLVYTAAAAVPVSSGGEAHCASQSTAKLISDAGSPNLTQRRLKAAISVKISFISTAEKHPAILFTRHSTSSPLTAAAACAMLTSGDLR